jgi:catechol 2,3-dioxygenase-like lactoylglutathione lyase family enzyme
LLITVATVYIAAQVGLTISMRAGAEAFAARPRHELQRISTLTERIGDFTLVVRDYAEAITYYTNVLGFELREQSVVFAIRGWLLVAPCGTRETRLLLVKPSTRELVRRLRDQTRGRVFPFLHTADFWGDYRTLRERGVRFRGEPHQVNHATVVVFEDRFGNKWDLVQWR